MTSKELYIKNARVWVPSSAEVVWEGAILQEDYKSNDLQVVVLTDKGERREIKIKNELDLPHLRNPAILIGQNDLTALSYLHEPDVLYNLEIRFRDRQLIYTYCGIVLVAINPYSELPLYGSDIIRAYRGHSMGELEPHIFAVSEEAYAKLEREKCDISIIVSGESGAGKTVSAKYAMRYFAAVGGSESETQIERKVLASSPIMEAIGNAKTTRNDNSSRFGKFTKLLFDNNLSSMSLMGASMQTYLLEKSRVVFQAPGERNYHIFYQMCAGREKYPELLLDHQDKFRFLNQGSSPNIVKVSDSQQFDETLNALTTLGFSSGEINDIIIILAGILHLGNITFTHRTKKDVEEVDHEEGCSISTKDLHLSILSEILKLNKNNLQKWLTTRQIESINENVLIPMNKLAAEAARDALAKHLYSKLFHFIVNTINRNLHGGKKQGCYIGVLDIYGFETFQKNSFEQFCINFANEKLQQQFNQHVFKLEQEEYLKEGIEWTMIDFYDNQPCLNLIESKLGILDLLDEECRMPSGSDESWVSKLIEKCSKYKQFDKPRFGCSAFLVKHFSDTVQYESHGFIEKNRDTVSKELLNVMQESDMAFCRNLILLDEKEDFDSEKPATTPGSGVKVVISASRLQVTPNKQHKQTVGSQFRDSLTQLIATLHATTPHYVRCIKPNDDKLPFQWEPSKIVQQLRACGVLETVRISAAGFPSRWSYEDFYSRYRLLCKRAQIVDWNEKATCTNIVRNWLNDEDKYRFGHTQIFFRAGQVAYLEQLRTDTRRKHIVLVQSLIRKFVYRNKYLRLKRTALGLQRHARGLLARRKAEKLRQHRAAVQIQRFMKGWYYRHRYEQTKNAVLAIQKHGRGMLARQRFKTALENYKATEVQRFCRGFLARRAFKKKQNSIILVQSLVRRWLAKKIFRKLKAEAKSFSHLEKRYKGLENKIIELQQKYDEINKQNGILKNQNADIPDLKYKADQLKGLENEMKQLKSQLSEREDRLINIQKQLDRERDEKMAVLEEKNRDEEVWTAEKQHMLVEKMDLKQQLVDITAKKEDEEQRVNRLMSEVDTNDLNQAYHKVIKDKDSLENENQLLRQEVKRLQFILQSHPNELENNYPSISVNEEDFGYSSNRNTLELQKKSTQNSEGDKIVTCKKLSVQNSSQNNSIITNMRSPMSFVDGDHITSTPNNSPIQQQDATVLMLRMRKLLEEEKNRGEQMRKELMRLKNKSSMSFNTEDSIKVSELEVENEKLRQDYLLLKNSIQRDVVDQELEAHANAMEDELKRRRDECIQLKSYLAQQSQTLRSLSGQPDARNESIQYNHDNAELMDVLQAQKLANRQLESELTALTEEHNLRITELNQQVDNLRSEKCMIESIIQDKLDSDPLGEEDDIILVEMRQKESYLRMQLQNSAATYVDLQEQLDEKSKKINDLIKSNNILCNRLRDHGLNDSILSAEINTNNIATVKKKEKKYQGILKFSNSDEAKILHRLIVDLKPRMAVTLLPSLPAFIIFMCIRYTDFVNADQHVKTLLTNYVLLVKKIYKLPNTIESRILWIVNSITLHNLLKQYGGNDEYIQCNTESQNQQQLKNFDLSEYRLVINESVIFMYETLVKQIQDAIKPFIVPAILYHDETARGKGNRGRAVSLESPDQSNKNIPELKSLVNQLEHFYKQFTFFGLDECYMEQIFKQLFYYICANALNNLMLRQDLCTWKTGMKIRFNIGCLESWIKAKKMTKDVLLPSIPLNEASLLLQSRKSEDDVENIFELCHSLTATQVLKLLKSYTLDDCENPITPTFIDKLSERLVTKETYNEYQNTFTMDENYINPLIVAYRYNELKLEDIEIPEELKLNSLLTKI